MSGLELILFAVGGAAALGGAGIGGYALKKKADNNKKKHQPKSLPSPLPTPGLESYTFPQPPGGQPPSRRGSHATHATTPPERSYVDAPAPPHAGPPEKRAPLTLSDIRPTPIEDNLWRGPNVQSQDHEVGFNKMKEQYQKVGKQILHDAREIDRKDEQRHMERHVEEMKHLIALNSPKNPADERLWAWLARHNHQQPLRYGPRTCRVKLHHPGEPLGILFRAANSSAPVEITGTKPGKAAFRAGVPQDGYLVSIAGRPVLTYVDMKNILGDIAAKEVLEYEVVVADREDLVGESPKAGSDPLRVPLIPWEMREQLREDVEDIHEDWLMAQSQPATPPQRPKSSSYTPPQNLDLPKASKKHKIPFSEHEAKVAHEISLMNGSHAHPTTPRARPFSQCAPDTDTGLAAHRRRTLQPQQSPTSAVSMSEIDRCTAMNSPPNLRQVLGQSEELPDNPRVASVVTPVDGKVDLAQPIAGYAPHTDRGRLGRTLAH